MTPEPVKALAELRALSDAATPGPWRYQGDRSGTNPPQDTVPVRLVLDGQNAAFVVALVNAFRADPAALLSPRVDVEAVRRVVYETFCGDDEMPHGETRDQHVERLVAAILNRDTGSAEPVE